MLSTGSTQALVLRSAGAADGPALHDLAALDSTRLRSGPYLVAEVDERIVAAVSLADRSVVADPFRPTAGVIAVLRARAAAEARPAARRGLRARLRGLARRSRVTAPTAPAV